jgi:thiamine-phosphate pyrophosphorylase
MPPSQAVLRIIDANLNRLGEGLRFLEETARFVLDDGRITTGLKNLRHSLSPKDPLLKTAYLSARDSSSDIGPSIRVNQAEPVRGLSQAVVANARRVEESLRVLEELAKTPDTGLDSAALQDARFAVYTLEKELVSRLLRQDKAALLSTLHAVVDTAALGSRGHAPAASEMLAGGARVIQLRDKTTPRGRLLDIALELAELCLRHSALFIVNDALDIALASDADGLHLGQDDLPVKVARRLLPVDKLVGCSVRTVAEAKKAQADGADYLGFGAVFSTSTKTESTPLGTVLISEIKKEVSLPLIAIGGISGRNVGDVLRAGADGAAVISALLSAESIESATRGILDAMQSCRRK